MTGVLGAVLPYLFGRCKSPITIFSYLNAASAGVLLGAAFIHMAPETSGVLDELAGGYPLGFLVFCLGIILMAWIYRIGGHSHDPPLAQKGHPQHVHHHPEEGQLEPSPVASGTFPPEKIQSAKSLGQASGGTSCKADDTTSYMDGTECQCQRVVCHECHMPYVTEPDPECQVHSHTQGGHATCQSLKTVLLLLLGLSVHSLTAGLSMGFASELDQVIAILIAIVLHKWCETTAQSLSGIRNCLPKCTNIGITIALSLVTPLGIGIGMLITWFSKGYNQTALDATSDFLTMFVCGTFVQIIFEEILLEYLPVHGQEHGHEHGQGHEQIKESTCSVNLKMLTLFLGFVFMALISLIEVFLGGHDHDHGHEHVHMN